MSAKAIREFHGKKLASRWLSQYSGDVKYNLEDRALLITASSMRPEDATNFDALVAQNPWLLTEKLALLKLMERNLSWIWEIIPMKRCLMISFREIPNIFQQ